MLQYQLSFIQVIIYTCIFTLHLYSQYSNLNFDFEFFQQMYNQLFFLGKISMHFQKERRDREREREIVYYSYSILILLAIVNFRFRKNHVN